MGVEMNIDWKDSSNDEKRLFDAISVLLGSNPNLLQFLFDPIRSKIRKRPGLLRDDSWPFSHGEQLLIRASLDIWSGGGHLQFWEMLETWDSLTWINFFRAIAKLKDLPFDFKE